ncbi:MAG: hypothetical protein OH316_01935 [Candidatus Parvarchaeota archaeon]|nr:hypothetical protein [Candidatus Parvarchaeota archaeon]MCW1301872.1 hypothetical protein [Candidatus Parvarchaeota archaeon]
MNKRGFRGFIDFVIALVIGLAIMVVVAYIFLYGSNSLGGAVSSISSYISLTQTSLTTGFSVLTGDLLPSFNDESFMAQFYGSSGCISLLNELSRNAVLTAPNNPSSLSGRFFVCSGTYKPFEFVASGSQSSSVWNYLSPSANDVLPNWVLYSKPQLSFLSDIAEVNGSKGTMTFINNSLVSNSQNYLSAMEEDLSQSCISFLNATVSPYNDYGVPSAYITAMDCVPLNIEGGQPMFISVKDLFCQTSGLSCNYNPFLFLHGSPGSITEQRCYYQSGDPSMSCVEYIG